VVVPVPCAPGMTLFPLESPFFQKVVVEIRSRRDRIVEELLATEQSYVKSLVFFISVSVFACMLTQVFQTSSFRTGPSREDKHHRRTTSSTLFKY
jgi:hypothetical protein